MRNYHRSDGVADIGKSLELRQLRHFRAVYEARGYVKAAEKLELTQQAVSASISKLEASLGAKLFRRDCKGAVLTDAGQALLKRARIILSDVRAAVEDIDALSSGHEGEAHIGVAGDPSGGVVPRALYEIFQKHPRITVSIAAGFSQDLKRDLLEGKLDGVVAAPDQEWRSDRDLIIEELYTTKLYIVCSAKHPLANRKSVTLENLQNYPWVFPRHPALNHQTVTSIYLEEGLAPPAKFIFCDNINAGQALIVLGEYVIPGYVQLNEMLLEHNILTILPIDVDFGVRSAYLAYRRNAVLNKATLTLFDYLRDAAKIVRDKPGYYDSTPVIDNA